MIRVITFDLWQTLISENPGDEEKRRSIRFERMLALLKGLGSESTLEALQQGYHACGEWLKEVWKQDRDVSTRDQVQFVIDQLDAGLRLTRPEWARLEEAYVSPIRDLPPVVLPGARETLTSLTAAGYRLGLICNTGRTPGQVLRPLLGRLGLEHAFQAMAFSDELGIRKPDPVIFCRVMKQLKANPGEAVHVGDIAETDVAGAKRAGMMALHLVRNGSGGSLEADGIIEGVGEVPEWVKGR